MLPTEIFGNVLVVHAPEEISEDPPARLNEFFQNCDKACVVLDIDGTENIDSSGLELLLSIQERLRNDLGDLKVSSSNAVNRKIFEITGLDQQIEVFECVVDAVQSFH
jgi:anti-anti-sigma factor